MNKDQSLNNNYSSNVTSMLDAEYKLRMEKRRKTMTYTVVFFFLLLVSCYFGEADIAVFLEGLPGILNYFKDITPVISAETAVADVREWYWGFDKWLILLADTILIAFLASFFGFIGALALSFLASDNLMKNKKVYFISRRVLEIARSVPDLVYALMFVYAFGLGPLPGIMAISIHVIGALGKLFSEAIENIDNKPLEGIRASGGNWFQVIRFGVMPQVLPNILSYSLLRFEINVRSASVIGFVGAGGIGQELMFVIRQFVYSDISAIVIMLIVTVVVIDMICEKLRHRLIGEMVSA